MAIVNELRKNGFYNIIARDLYEAPEKHDYLVADDPEYDILITNPPYAQHETLKKGLKYLFLEKAIKSKKPFALLLPVISTATVEWYNICKGIPLHIEILTPRVEFYIMVKIFILELWFGCMEILLVKLKIRFRIIM
jgi:hypothetical protein